MKIFYNALLTLILTGLTIHGFGQIQQGGAPYSFSNPGIRSMETPVINMPGIDVARLEAEDALNDRNKDIPWRFGENLFVNINPSNSGRWTNLDNGEKLWRLRIKCPDALTINLTFNRYRLPSGAKLFIYNSDESQIIGAFTDFNNQDDFQFATTLIKGDEITLEYFEPANTEFPGELNLYRVTHGYRNVFDFAKSFGSSGSCNNNVACPEAAGWENEIKSACMLVSGGSGFCSGALVNTTGSNGTPYILTANHCYSDPGSWVFWFNWQSPTCANPASNPGYNSISGATLRARNADSDFCLVQMSSTPPSGYNVYYSGWNRENAAASSGAGIHHPAGDIKKISYSNTAFTSDTWSGTPSDSHWKVNWSDGVTEGGSSGSPIFDQNHRIAGQLHGGPSGCGGSSLWDFYGKFSMSWDRGTTSATRLKDWLDPTNIAGLTQNGFDPNLTTDPPVANFSASNTNPGVNNQVNFTDLSTNNPTSWLWSFSPSTITYLNGTTSSSKNPQVSFEQTGFYTVTLTATNAYGSDNEVKNNYINVISCTFNTLPFTENFSTTSLPFCWSQVDNQGNGQIWQFGTITGQPTNPALTGNYAYLNSDAYGSGNSQNADLITPTLNLSAYSSVTLQFNHYFLSFTGSSGKLSYSINNGSTWILLQTYTTTSPTNPTNFSQSIAAVAGQSQVKFKWNYTGTYGYYWAIDDILITGTTVTPTLTVTPPNQNVTPPAGSTAFTVTSNSTWAVNSNQTWCAVTPSGSGNGNINASYSENSSVVPRIAEITVTVNGLTPVIVTVSQAGATPNLGVTPPNQNVASPAGSAIFAVTSNTSWTAVSDQTWCTVAPSGSGNGTITASYLLNTTTQARTANITVFVTGLSPVVVTVNQDGTQPSAFSTTIRNVVQSSAVRMEFDIYLLDTDPVQPFILAGYQAGIYINPSILPAGATLTVGILSNATYSQLNSNQQPTNIAFEQAINSIKLAGRTPPGIGVPTGPDSYTPSGTIIGTSGFGTRVCRIRVTSSLPFVTNSQPNLQFFSSDVVVPLYATRVSHYDDTNATIVWDPDMEMWGWGVPPINVQLDVIPDVNANVLENPFLNPPPLIDVTPADQNVTSGPGTAIFTVTSNTNWTASSDQTWCTVTNAGFGNGMINSVFTENSLNFQRIANITVTATGLPPVVVTLTQQGAPEKVLNLFLLLEGLYGANGTMNPAMNASGVQWGSGIADLITIELHEVNNYLNIVYSIPNVFLLTNGNASATIPSGFNGNYFVTVRHRNSIETVSMNPVDFSSATTAYSFDLPSKVFGNNLKLLFDGSWAVFGGDVTQNGSIDIGDMTPVDNAALNFVTGYVVSDLNGDGSVDIGDFSIIDNNQLNFVTSKRPQ